MSGKAKNEKAVVFLTDTLPIKVEALTDKKYRFQTIGTIANVINDNNRVIPMTVQRDAPEKRLRGWRFRRGVSEGLGYYQRERKQEDE